MREKKGQHPVVYVGVMMNTKEAYLWAKKMAQWLRAPIPLVEDLSSTPSTHNGKLTIARS